MNWLSLSKSPRKEPKDTKAIVFLGECFGQGKMIFNVEIYRNIVYFKTCEYSEQ